MKKIIVLLLLHVFISFPGNITYADDRIREQIDSMTMIQKVGQIIMLGIQAPFLNERDLKHIGKINPGGIVFYARNFNDASDIPPLIAQVQAVAVRAGLPLFFAIDQEGGVVHRIKGELYKPPSAATIGAANSAELSREIGCSVGSALRQLGINMNLAPVLDMPSDILASPMTLRSFGNDPKTVEKLGIAYIQGLQDSGVLATAKHFPGIGRATEDTHYMLPHIVWKTRDEREADLVPFRGAILSGVDLIMVGHVIAGPGDSSNPVSLSPYWMTEVLRKDMAFRGLIIVDNIEMKPIKDMMPISRAAVESFKAGADMIMVSHEKENQEAVFQALLHAVSSGEIPEARLNESLFRIIMEKRKVSTHVSCARAKDLAELSKTVAEHAIVGIRAEDAPRVSIKRENNVLYAGNNSRLFQVIRETFRTAGILNTSLENYKKMNPSMKIRQFLEKYDALIIDADYADATQIVSLCDKLHIGYFVLQCHLSNIRKTIRDIRPARMIILFEVNRTYLELGLEILSGSRKAKGRLPFHLPLPAGFVYMR